MLYLNDQFDGGCTNFVDENQELYMVSDPSAKKLVLDFNSILTKKIEQNLPQTLTKKIWQNLPQTPK